MPLFSSASTFFRGVVVDNCNWLLVSVMAIFVPFGQVSFSLAHIISH